MWNRLNGLQAPTTTCETVQTKVNRLGVCPDWKHRSLRQLLLIVCSSWDPRLVVGEDKKGVWIQPVLTQGAWNSSSVQRFVQHMRVEKSNVEKSVYSCASFNLASELWCASFQKSMGVTFLFEELRKCGHLAADPNRKLTPRRPERDSSAVWLCVYTSSWLLLCTSECCKFVGDV